MFHVYSRFIQRLSVGCRLTPFPVVGRTPSTEIHIHMTIGAIVIQSLLWDSLNHSKPTQIFDTRTWAKVILPTTKRTEFFDNSSEEVEPQCCIWKSFLFGYNDCLFKHIAWNPLLRELEDWTVLNTGVLSPGIGGRTFMLRHGNWNWDGEKSNNHSTVLVFLPCNLKELLRLVEHWARP